MTTTQYSVADETAIVTGASSGIGKRIAEQFAGDGANVVICSREQANVDPVAESINGNDSPGRAVAVECDVTDRDAVTGLVDTTIEEFGGLDVLVNNAGASFMAPFQDISENGWKTIVDINLHGTFHASQVAGERMQESSGGSIVNIASVAGVHGSPYMSHYSASKAAVINLTKTLAFEWAGNDIRVNGVAPGFVATPGVKEQMGVTADDIDRDSVDRQIGTVDEIADIVQFLASDASSYIVGETITAQGRPRIEEELPDSV
jgi:3-oxoacyl-[acyl-carrier protein] reductase